MTWEADLRKDIRDDPQGRTGQKNSHPINFAPQSPKRDRLSFGVLGQFEKVHHGQAHGDPSTEVVAKSPIESSTLEKSTEDQPYRESKRLSEAETGKTDISAFTHWHRIGQNAECSRQTHGGCDALKCTEQNQLDTRLGYTASQDEGPEQEATNEVDHSIAHEIGQRPGEKETASICKSAKCQRT